MFLEVRLLLLLAVVPVPLFCLCDKQHLISTHASSSLDWIEQEAIGERTSFGKALLILNMQLLALTRSSSATSQYRRP